MGREELERDSDDLRSSVMLLLLSQRRCTASHKLDYSPIIIPPSNIDRKLLLVGQCDAVAAHLAGGGVVRCAPSMRCSIHS